MNNKRVTAKQLAVYIRRHSESGYEPKLTSIHKILQKYGLSTIKQHGVDTYNFSNAMNCLSQHISELKEEDRLKDVYDFKLKNNMFGKPEQKTNNNYVPRKHDETNISLDQLKIQLDEKLNSLIKYIKSIK